MNAQRYFRRARAAILIAALLAGVFLLGLCAVADGDIWWHLAAGREMLRAGSLLYSDPFSVSAAGRPWVDVHWLFQLAVYGVHRLGGLSALVFGKSLLLATGAALSLAVFRRPSERSARGLFVVTLLAALFCIREQLQLRPVIPTLLFLSFFWFELERFHRRPSLRPLFTLPLVQVLWANVQGLFVLGPGLVAAYAVAAVAWLHWGDRRWFPFACEALNTERAARVSRLLLLLLPLCVAACFLTPYGVQGTWLPSLLLSRVLPESGNVFSANVAENVPPFASQRLLPGQFWHLQWFFGFLGLSLIARGRRLRLSQLAIVGGLSLLALMANRNVLLLYWLGTPIAVLWLAPALARAARVLSRRRALFVPRALGQACVLALLLLAASALARESTLSSPAPFRVPEASASRIAAEKRPGSIFAADHYGGYLIWRLFPEHRPYIDTRLVLRTAAEYSEYLAIADEPTRFDDFQRRHGFEYVLLPTAYPDRYLGLIAHLYRSPDWKLLYTDGSEVLFARRQAAFERGWDLAARVTTEHILSDLSRKYAGSPILQDAARVHLATLELSLAEFDEAERSLSGVERPEAEALRARCRLAQGDTRQAREITLRLLKSDGSQVQSLNLLALLSLERGEPGQAVSLLRRSLAVDPFDAEAERILSNLEDQQHVEAH